MDATEDVRVFRSGWVASAIALFALIFLAVPILIVIPMSLTSGASLAFPPPSLSFRWYSAFLNDRDWLAAAMTSFTVALISSTFSTIVGALGTYGLVRWKFRGNAMVEANYMSPIIVPNIVLAVALYIFFARIGIIGSWGSLIAAHSILSIPFVVIIISNALRSFDERVEVIAATLGASPIRIFLRVTLPNLIPAVVSSWILAFVVSFDEVVLTLFLAGSHETLPKRMFSQMMVEVSPMVAVVAALMIVVNLLAILLYLVLTGSSNLKVGELPNER